MDLLIEEKEFVRISRSLWEWARNRPEYHDLIEDLEDLEHIAQARADKEDSISLEDYHSQRIGKEKI
ncbi:hypothetical protein ISS30_00140 [bacterium]|nr:hypothetical protein [FCB group bacterium]MBL7190078.1 hypothetical protein [bacterium]